jgi:hypothetical protein
VAIENGKQFPKLNKLAYPMGQYFGRRIGGDLVTPTLSQGEVGGTQLPLGPIAQVGYIMDKCWSKITMFPIVLMIPIHR